MRRRLVLPRNVSISPYSDTLFACRQAENKKRLKARKAATKSGAPLFEEDGVARGLLEKYDEEAPDDGMQIIESGVVADERTRRQEEIRRKLAAGLRAFRAAAVVGLW